MRLEVRLDALHLAGVAQRGRRALDVCDDRLEVREQRADLRALRRDLLCEIP